MDFMQYYNFDENQKSNVIKNIFKKISDDDIQYILNNSNVKKYQKNEIIIQRDKYNKYSDDSLYVLLDGIIQIGYLSPSGRFHAFNYYSEKNFINLFSCLQDEIPEYDYYAFNQIRVLIIPKQLFFQIIYKNNDLSQELMKMLAKRMHYLMAELKFLHIASLHQKVCKILLNLAAQYGIRHTAGIEIKLKISQHDLADLLSASRQTVNKEIKKLVNLDVLNWQYENIIIKDLKYLESRNNNL